MDVFLQAAIDEARKGLAEGGIRPLARREGGSAARPGVHFSANALSAFPSFTGADSWKISGCYDLERGD